MKTWMLSAALAFAAGAAVAADTEPQVALEFRVFNLRDKAAKDIKPTDTAMTAADVAKLMESLNTCKANGSMEMLSAPKVVALNGQNAVVKVMNREQVLTGVTITAGKDGQSIPVPTIQHVDVGLDLQCLPQMSADRKSVTLSGTCVRTYLNENAPPMPFTTFITPEFEGGSQGVPVPFTTFLRSADVKTMKLETAMVLADGQSMLVKLGKRNCTTTVEHKVPVLGDMPILGELFSSTAVDADVEHTFILVTATVVLTEPHDPAPPVAVAPRPIMPLRAAPPVYAECYAAPAGATSVPPVKNPEILKILLEQYHVACKTGDTAKARTIAAFCLEMDPLCFAKR